MPDLQFTQSFFVKRCSIAVSRKEKYLVSAKFMFVPCYLLDLNYFCDLLLLLECLNYYGVFIRTFLRLLVIALKTVSHVIPKYKYD